MEGCGLRSWFVREWVYAEKQSVKGRGSSYEEEVKAVVKSICCEGEM